MSRRRLEVATSPLEHRLEALDRARELGQGRVPAETESRVFAVLERASQRRSLSAEHTVVGFFGATGSGKSSLVNAVVGQDVAKTAATRPTTSSPLAVVARPAGSGALLDWLEVPERHELDAPWLLDGTAGRKKPTGTPGEPGLILLDLPDLDSTALAHRETAQRLAGQVDVLVWVLDPQKYADAAVHHGFIRPMASHEAVTLVVLNQIDRLRPEQVQPVLDSLRGVLKQDGLHAPRILPVSARTGQGVEELRGAIADVVRRREAGMARLMADIAGAAGSLHDGGPAHQPLRLPEPDAQRRLAGQLASAAGVETVVDAARRSYRLQAAARTGWPATRWLRKLRPDPLRRLNLRSRDVNPAVNRTSLPAPGAAQRAQADSAVRAFAEEAAKGAPEAWRSSIRRAARSSTPRLPDALDQAIARTDIGADRGSWWWPLFGTVQWIALAAALAGAGWLGALAVMGYLQLPVPAAPQVEGFPVPTLLLAGGVLCGLVLAMAGGLIARAAAAGRARRAGRRLRAAIAETAEAEVVVPVRSEIERYNAFVQAVADARG